MNLYEHLIQASGEGYSGKYRFVNTNEGWLLKGQGGDYLTPGIGVPIYGVTPEVLLETIRIRRPKIQISILPTGDRND
jgi:hypothetical protein